MTGAVSEDGAVLETERLVLRRLRDDDFCAMCTLLQDPAVMYAYEGPFDDDMVRDWMRRQQERYRDDGFGLWAAVSKADGEFVGQCGITYQQYAGMRVPEVGYLLCCRFWHRGYATEAASACRDHAFGALGFDEVYAIIRDNNSASQRVARRIDMSPVGETVKFYRGVRMPHVVYSVRPTTCGERMPVRVCTRLNTATVSHDRKLGIRNKSFTQVNFCYPRHLAFY